MHNRPSFSFRPNISRGTLAAVALWMFVSLASAQNTVTGSQASAGGIGNTASGDLTSAFGFRNSATAKSASALGKDNHADAEQSTAVGVLSFTSGLGASAVGYHDVASGIGSSALGSKNSASGLSASALGRSNIALGYQTSAFGSYNFAVGLNAAAFGHGNQANGDYSVAVGIDNGTTSSNAFAFGRSNFVTANNAIAIGRHLINNIANSLMIGPSDAAKVTIAANGNVGIGTTGPAAKLEVMGDSSGNPVTISTAGSATSHVIVKRSGQATLNWGSYPGYYTSGLQIQNNDNTRFIWLSPLDAASGQTAELRVAAAGFSIYSGGTITDGGNLGFSQSSSGNVGIGTTNPGAYKLAVVGAIRAQEVVVNTGWSDYVFAPEYQLPALSDVEAHIKAEKHLPGIPSAKEVADHGINVGAMQAKLLAKIEELTLHMIEQEKRLQRLEGENASLRTSR